MSNKIIIFTDGGARGNPGPAAIGGTILFTEETRKSGKTLVPERSRRTTFSQCIGKTTNNDAEYQAVIFALKKTKELLGKQAKDTTAQINLDSELIYKQMLGEYRVKVPHLQKHFIAVNNLIKNFHKVEFNFVRREKNKEADKLVNKALDEELGNRS